MHLACSFTCGRPVDEGDERAHDDVGFLLQQTLLLLQAERLDRIHDVLEAATCCKKTIAAVKRDCKGDPERGAQENQSVHSRCHDVFNFSR